MQIPPERIEAGYRRVRELLLAERTPSGHWVGELSTSALSTATAVMALEQVRRARGDYSSRSAEDTFAPLIDRGLAWLAQHQNTDGGWGDTTASFSNISTTMLCHAVFHATGQTDHYRTVVQNAGRFIDAAGGVPALRRRYGRDKTFSIPILTHCALAGLVPWKEVSSLPFELACVPHQFYKWIQLPVVSYALPALIAIGQCHAYHRPSWNPLLRGVRQAAIEPTLRLLERIQPTSGGFLEATPLTSFVTMSLASCGRHDHPVVRRGVQFILDSIRPDGSWPIDTNLATWVTTLSINALGPDLPLADRPALAEFLSRQQYRTVHPYTQAAPGGWAWTDLSGGVPDADDTPGAVLAIDNLLNAVPELPDMADRPDQPDASSQNSLVKSVREQADWNQRIRNAARWLLDLQNRDGGWPTFCRGWGALPFDRSSADLTAHAIRALTRWESTALSSAPFRGDVSRAVAKGFAYLSRQQRADGSWLPLWFGNQHHPDDENATYGTARVLAAYRDVARNASRDLTQVARLSAGTSVHKTAPSHYPSEYSRGRDWLILNQNDDGSWGGAKGLPPSIEESALALEILIDDDFKSAHVQRGLEWLLTQIESNKVHEQSPIGFYFAKLWYSEKLYPLCFATQTMRYAVDASRRAVVARM